MQTVWGSHCGNKGFKKVSICPWRLACVKTPRGFLFPTFLGSHFLSSHLLSPFYCTPVLSNVAVLDMKLPGIPCFFSRLHPHLGRHFLFLAFFPHMLFSLCLFLYYFPHSGSWCLPCSLRDVYVLFPESFPSALCLVDWDDHFNLNFCCSRDSCLGLISIFPLKAYFSKLWALCGCFSAVRLHDGTTANPSPAQVP